MIIAIKNYNITAVNKLLSHSVVKVCAHHKLVVCGVQAADTFLGFFITLAGTQKLLFQQQITKYTAPHYCKYVQHMYCCPEGWSIGNKFIQN